MVGLEIVSFPMSCCTQGTAQTFRWSSEPIILSIGISRVQLKSNRTVGERLVAFDEGAVT